MRQAGLICQALVGNGKVLGYRKLTDDLRDKGKWISETRAALAASLVGIVVRVGCWQGPDQRDGRPAIVAETRLV